MPKKKDEKKAKERVLIVEDDFANAMGAMMAFKENKDVGDVKVASTYKAFLELLDTYKPTTVLSDAQIPKEIGKGTQDYKDEISKELDKRHIPYIFVTRGMHGHHELGPVEILKKEGDEYQKIKEFETSEKDDYVWKEAYQRLKKKTKK